MVYFVLVVDIQIISFTGFQSLICGPFHFTRMASAQLYLYSCLQSLLPSLSCQRRFCFKVARLASMFPVTVITMYTPALSKSVFKKTKSRNSTNYTPH